MKRFALVIISCVQVGPAFAACEPPKGEHKIACKSCGNLEQNPMRGVALAWNELLDNAEMQRDLENKGLTLVVLDKPRHSSRGVLWYAAIIRDPTFEVVNTDKYAEMISLQRELDRGFSGSLGIGGPRGGAEARWRRSLRVQIDRARTLAIRTSTKPFEVEIRDQRGRGFKGNVRKIPRNNLAMDELDAGRNDLVPEDRYENELCFHKDKRQFLGRGRAGGAARDGRDNGGRGRGTCSINEKFRCRDDFSNPKGSGKICSYDVKISCA